MIDAASLVIGAGIASGFAGITFCKEGSDIARIRRAHFISGAALIALGIVMMLVM